MLHAASGSELGSQSTALVQTATSTGRIGMESADDSSSCFRRIKKHGSLRLLSDQMLIDIH